MGVKGLRDFAAGLTTQSSSWGSRTCAGEVPSATRERRVSDVLSGSALRQRFLPRSATVNRTNQARPFGHSCSASRVYRVGMAWPADLLPEAAIQISRDSKKVGPGRASPFAQVRKLLGVDGCASPTWKNGRAGGWPGWSFSQLISHTSRGRAAPVVCSTGWADHRRLQA
jgi:hypothetical protein